MVLFCFFNSLPIRAGANEKRWEAGEMDPVGARK